MSTTTLELRDLALHLGDVFTRVRAGEEIIISDGGETVAHLLPPPAKRAAPQFGYFAGQVKMADDFDAPLPDALLAEFEK